MGNKGCVVVVPPSQPTFLFVAPESCDSVLNSMPRRSHSLATLVSSVSHSVTTDQAMALEETRPPFPAVLSTDALVQCLLKGTGYGHCVWPLLHCVLGALLLGDEGQDSVI